MLSFPAKKSVIDLFAQELSEAKPGSFFILLISKAHVFDVVSQKGRTGVNVNMVDLVNVKQNERWAEKDALDYTAGYSSRFRFEYNHLNWPVPSLQA